MLKYPLTAPARRVNVSDGFGHLSKPLTPSLLHKEFEKGASHWVRNVTYFNLLHTYLELLFPLSQTSASLSVEDMAIRKLPDGSEFFLSIAVDFWLDTSRIIKRNFPLADALKTNYGSLSLNRMASLSNTSSHQQLHATHPSPMDTLLIDDGAAVGTSQWTVLSLQAAYLFISRILQQKSLNAQLDYLQKAYAQHKSSNARSSRVSLNQLSSPSSSTNDKASSVRYLPHAMLVFQSPMFENLKWIFNKANTIDPSLFICAAELWLLVLEPWKANGGESPSSSSSYSVQWRSYIVAYFHFYTTLLAVFLRSISKMDLVPSSPHSVEDAALLLLLEKLLTVFTPALNDLLEDIISGVYQRLRNVHSTSSNAAEKEESSSVARSIRISECDVAASHHWEMFPDLSIVDRNDVGLVSVKLNAHNECKIIVESLIYRSHSPAKATGIWSVFNDWGGTSSEGKVKDIVRKSSANVVRMITEVLCIVDASVLTQVQSAASKERRIEDVLSDADRIEQTSKLTALGRNQIVTGARKCSKTSLRFQGDQMLRPFMSTEWRVLARYLVDISVHFNNKWNLPADSSYTNSTWAELCRLCMKDRRLVPTLLRKSYRVNLRPLADIWAVGLVLTLFLRTFLYCRLVSTPFFLLLVTLIVAISYVKSNAFFRVR